MEESELDEWFEETRKELEERTMARLMDRKEDPEKVRAAFDVAYKRLLVDLQKRQVKTYEQRIRRERFAKPVAAFHAWRKDLAQRWTDWWQFRKVAFAKWRFDRKIRRIIRDEKLY